MVKGLSHIGLVVKDIEKQTAFYRDAIGLRVLHEREVEAPPDGDHTGVPGVRRKLVFMGDAGSMFSALGSVFSHSQKRYGCLSVYFTGYLAPGGI